jgi:hypothetical protein
VRRTLRRSDRRHLRRNASETHPQRRKVRKAHPLPPRPYLILTLE